jgi:hypothetical protein
VAIAVARGEDRGMPITYGVVWREGDGELARGRLELLPGAVRLDGIAGTTPVLRELPYDELESVRVGRTGSDRLNGHPSLVLKPRRAEPFVIAAVAQAGVVAELTERLARLALG